MGRSRPASRASSKKTRIETPLRRRQPSQAYYFEGKFQENKDWNIGSTSFSLYACLTSRASSKKTRIETRRFIHRMRARALSSRASSKKTRIETQCSCWLWHGRGLCFEGKFQENKDWNLYMYVDTAMILFSLRGQVPRKQGLKLLSAYPISIRISLRGQVPRKQGLKPEAVSRSAWATSSSRASSKKTRIETYRNVS